MIPRLLYYAQLLPNAEQSFRDAIKEEADALRSHWHEHGLADVSVFLRNSHVCVYAETSGDANAGGWDWPQTFSPYLERWPDMELQKKGMYRLALPMIDIFHDGVPGDQTSWRGSRKAEERVGSIARLKPEQVSSYIFYHFQRQEEDPESFNKTYLIGCIGRLLFSYHELPANISPSKPTGLLDTKLSPVNWQEVMLPHFELWTDVPDNQRIWSRMELLLTF